MDKEQIKTAERHTREEGYIHHSLVALDIFVNVLTGGNEDETIIIPEHNIPSFKPARTFVGRVKNNVK